MRNGGHQITFILLVFSGWIFFAGGVWGAVTGDCVNCHTMHNSQNGQAMIFDLEERSDIPRSLLRTDCVGCHSSTGSDTIVPLGNSRVPIVYNAGGGLQYPANGSSNSVLAGGNFYWVVANGDEYGHNVYGISDVDGALSSAPGGSGCNDCHGTLASAASGCAGCHLVAHHRDDGEPGPAGEEDGWYRFLGQTMAKAWLSGQDRQHEQALAYPGTMGIEDPHWEQNPSSTQHNVYKGTEEYYDKTTSWYGYDNIYHTIGEVCTGCHSNFHHPQNPPGIEGRDGMGSSGAWIRHPNDVVIPGTGEYTSYTTYDPLVPVSVPDLSVGVISEVRPGTDLVSCISCHRPHGSPFPDMLRWDYVNDCNTGSPDSASNRCGCYTCHSTKDGSL